MFLNEPDRMGLAVRNCGDSDTRLLALPSGNGSVFWRVSNMPSLGLSGPVQSRQAFLGQEDIERLLAACQGKNELRDRAIILLLARIGLACQRGSES